jgi:hypothetical protein
MPKSSDVLSLSLSLKQTAHLLSLAGLESWGQSYLSNALRSPDSLRAWKSGTHDCFAPESDPSMNSFKRERFEGSDNKRIIHNLLSPSAVVKKEVCRFRYRLARFLLAVIYKQPKLAPLRTHTRTSYTSNSCWRLLSISSSPLP